MLKSDFLFLFYFLFLKYKLMKIMFFHPIETQRKKIIAYLENNPIL